MSDLEDCGCEHEPENGGGCHIVECERHRRLDALEAVEEKALALLGALDQAALTHEAWEAVDDLAQAIDEATGDMGEEVKA